ncbi:hypothetical protein E2C01_053748 [Portunus trituberculatus]|uniref:Uncharacterized protein n=1 Tax=Portunus trituberculatus TaxID=210409 RepID=A0A5B7GHK8_PORTR|nr:hypothetical protein [Portunus trituberculatus]
MYKLLSLTAHLLSLSTTDTSYSTTQLVTPRFPFPAQLDSSIVEPSWAEPSHYSSAEAHHHPPNAHHTTPPPAAVGLKTDSTLTTNHHASLPARTLRRE